MRGQENSQQHTTEDLLEDNPETYWDFDSTAYAYKDLPAVLAQIKSEREDEARECKKTTIVGEGNGGRIAILAAADE